MSGIIFLPSRLHLPALNSKSNLFPALSIADYAVVCGARNEIDDEAAREFASCVEPRGSGVGAF